MSDDLVKRLREDHNSIWQPFMDEAADRIEALEAQLAEAQAKSRELALELLQAHGQAFDAQARPVGVKVKDLEWDETQADTILGTYDFGIIGGIWTLRLNAVDIETGVESNFRRAAGAAKDAAYDHYKAHILDALEPAPVGVEEAARVLSDLSGWLGAGAGDELTTPDQFAERIRWGVNYQIESAIRRCADKVNEMSKRPHTTWGEVYAALRALSGEAGE